MERPAPRRRLFFILYAIGALIVAFADIRETNSGTRLYWGSIAEAYWQCSNLFTYEKEHADQVREWEGNRLTRQYYSLNQKLRNQAKDSKETITIHHSDGTTSEMKTPENLRTLLDPKKSIDIAVMGYLGKIFDLRYDPNTQSHRYFKNEYYFNEQSTLAKKRFNSLPPELTTNFSNKITKLLQPEQLDNGLVMIKMDLSYTTEFTSSEKAVRDYFSMGYMQLVNGAYRASGLEKNKSLSSFTMLDEVAENFIKYRRSFKLYMIYDKEVFHSLLRMMESRERDGEDISENAIPFFPSAGVAVTYDLINPSKPLEIKRYFKNEFEDPMGLLNLEPHNEFQVRHRMLYRMIESQPSGQELEIHAHTMVHAKAYLKLGFKKAGEMENPNYPGVKVIVLKATREEAMAKIQTILNGSK